MTISYDKFVEAFLFKIREYDFLEMPEEGRTAIIDGFLKRAFVAFRKNCKWKFYSNSDDELREYNIETEDEEEDKKLIEDIDELVEIVSEGMVLQWLKPFLYNQELLENALNTRDFSTYSPAELLHRVKEVHDGTQKSYIQGIREYSYNHNNLTELHI